MYKTRAPIVRSLLRTERPVPGADIQAGQELFRKRDLMNYGSVLVTGRTSGLITRPKRSTGCGGDEDTKSGGSYATLGMAPKAAIDAEIAEELRTNRYEAGTGALVFTEGQVLGWERIVQRYGDQFRAGEQLAHCRRAPCCRRTKVATSRAPRRGDKTVCGLHYVDSLALHGQAPRGQSLLHEQLALDPGAGNGPTSGALIWSAVSVAGLVLFFALILYFHHRYRLEAAEVDGASLRFDLRRNDLTPSQRAAAKFFVVALLLFLVQTVLGGKMAHDYADGATFYGFPLNDILPFNVARTWHLQLAIFWIATAWLGMGIFIAPLVNPKEPRGQRALVNILFGALVVVVVGSMAGEWLSVKGYLGENWYWLGTQGWEYLELGRLWMYLLIGGMLIWLYIVYRGLRGALPGRARQGRSDTPAALLLRRYPGLLLLCALHREGQPHHHGRLLALVADPPLGRGNVRSVRRGRDRLPDGAARISDRRALRYGRCTSS